MRLAPRACVTPGCPSLALQGARCAACTGQRALVYDRRRGSSTARGYTEAHRRLRVLAFIRDGWRCVDCGFEPTVVRESNEYHLDDPPTEIILAELKERWRRGDVHLHGDHDIPIEERPDLRLDLDNYRTRCNHCHNAKTSREQQGRFDTHQRV